MPAQIYLLIPTVIYSLHVRIAFRALHVRMNKCRWLFVFVESRLEFGNLARWIVEHLIVRVLSAVRFSANLIDASP